MPEVALGLSILAVLLGGYAIFTLQRLMTAIEDLNTSLANTVAKLERVEENLQASQKQMASLVQAPHPSSILDMVPGLLQKNGIVPWGPIALLGLRAFEAYFKKRRSRRNASAHGDVGTDSRK